MEVTLLTPIGALLALGAAVPLLALRLVRRRARTVRAALHLSEPGALSRRVPTVALAAAGALLGLAAAQPRVSWTSERIVRADAEAFVVVDTSRSMLARTGQRGTIRFARATDAALRLRGALPEVPVGLASFTDRVLPHVFASPDDDVFAATLRRSIGVDRPPPQGLFTLTATRLAALEAVVTRRFFSPAARKRLLFVITDGESIPLAGARLATTFRTPPGLDTIFVHVWRSDERVYEGAAPEPQYRPDVRARAILDAAAASLGGAVYGEEDLDGAIARARSLLGDGPTVARGERRNRLALAPYLAGAVFLPLALLLWRRDR